MESKGKDTTELRDKKMLCEVAFLCDITSHLNALNLQRQGRDRVVTDMYGAARAFESHAAPVGDADAARKLEPFSVLPNYERASLYRRVPKCTV